MARAKKPASTETIALHTEDERENLDWLKENGLTDAQAKTGIELERNKFQAQTQAEKDLIPILLEKGLLKRDPRIPIRKIRPSARQVATQIQRSLEIGAAVMAKAKANRRKPALKLVPHSE